MVGVVKQTTCLMSIDFPHEKTFYLTSSERTNDTEFFIILMLIRMNSLFYGVLNIDPLGRPQSLPKSDHYFHTCCPFGRQSVNINFKLKSHCQSDCGLAEWIIDNFCLVDLKFGYWCCDRLTRDRTPFMTFASIVRLFIRENPKISEPVSMTSFVLTLEKSWKKIGEFDSKSTITILHVLPKKLYFFALKINFA